MSTSLLKILSKSTILFTIIAIFSALSSPSVVGAADFSIDYICMSRFLEMDMKYYPDGPGGKELSLRKKGESSWNNITNYGNTNWEYISSQGYYLFYLSDMDANTTFQLRFDRDINKYYEFNTGAEPTQDEISNGAPNPCYFRNLSVSTITVSDEDASGDSSDSDSSNSSTEEDPDNEDDDIDSSSSNSSTSLSDSKITSIFVSVYGRSPSSSELSYWRDRSEEKRTEGELKGAMEYAKSQDDSDDDDSEDTTESHTETETKTEDLLLVRTTPNPTDPDGDGLPNDQEELYGTDPNNFDTDGDGRPDGLEVREGSSPLLPHNPEDFDNDGVSDAEEEERGTDPRNADTDNDGVLDGDEIRAGRDPLVDEGEEFSPTEQEGEGNGEEAGELPEQEEKPSFGRRLWQNLTAPFRAIGRLFSRIF